MNVDDLIVELTVTAELVPAEVADARMPRGQRGLYTIFMDEPNNLPGTFGRRLAASGTNLIYVGKAGTSLHDRLVRQDLRHKKSSTFFRSLGAVLGYSPVLGRSFRPSTSESRTFTRFVTLQAGRALATGGS